MFSRIRAFVLLASLAFSGLAFGASTPTPLPDYTGLYDFDTVAGSAAAGLHNNDSYDEPGQFDRIAYRAPAAIVGDKAGLIVADTGNGVLRLINAYHAEYLLSPYQLTGTVAYPDTLFLSQPSGLALTSDRVLYIAETGGNRIQRYILPNDFTPGRLAVFAGNGKIGHVNGSGRAARFNAPTALAADHSGNVFVADTGNHVIRKISASGVVTTFAGSPGKSGSADGKGSRARFSSPRGLATDPAGNLYVADTDNHLIRVIRPDGTVSTLAGFAASPGAENGVGSAARFSSPRGLRVRVDGKLIVADTGNHTLRLVTSRGKVETLAGIAGLAGRSDGPAVNASFSSPSDLTLLSDGTIIVTDTGNHRLRSISRALVVSTHSGLPGAPGFVDGNEATTRLDQPSAFAVTEDGLYFTDFGNQALRRLSWNQHEVSTIAEVPISSGGGLAPFLHGETFYLSDPSQHTLRAIYIATGESATAAGTAGTSGAADGPASLATFNSPRGMALARDGRIYIADSANNTIRRYDPAAEIIDTVAGRAGKAGASDGAATTEAKLRTPWALAFGPNDTLYILERDSGSIRTLSPDGSVGTRYLDTEKRLDAPTTLAVDSDGNIVVGDSRNRLFILPPDGNLGILIDDKVGVGSEDDWLVRYEGNHAVDTARINHPDALAFGPGDTLYIADTGNSLIRQGRPPMHNLASDSLHVVNTGRDIVIEASAPVRLISDDLPAAVGLYGPEANNRSSRFYRFFPNSPASLGVYPCTLRAEFNDYARVRSLRLQVLPANHQEISLSPTYFTYDGTPKTPTVLAPEDLTITAVLYDGSDTPPTEGGKHVVTVIYSANGATASKDLEIFINQSDYPRFTIPAGPFVADGQPFNPLADQPFGNIGTWAIRSGPAKVENNQIVLLAAGDVELLYQLPNTPNYCISSVVGTIHATASSSTLPASIILGGLESTYDGAPQNVTITTEPAGLTVLVRYANPLALDQTTGLPRLSGDHPLEVIISTPGYSGYATAIQSIAKAHATIIATPRAEFLYNGQTYEPQVVTNPPGLPVSFRIDFKFNHGGAVLRPGNHIIEIKIADPNYIAEPVIITETVKKRPITVRPIPASRPVGAANPTITFAIEGLPFNSQEITLPAPSIDATPQSPPGIYTVKPAAIPSGGGLAALYDITLVDGTLEVLAHRGNYQTLLLSQTTGLPEALLTIKVAGPTGVFTGTLRYRDETFPVKGRFAYATDPTAAGTATASWQIRYTQSAYRSRDRLAIKLTLSKTLEARLVSHLENKRLPIEEQTVVHVSETDLVTLLEASGRPAVAFAGRHTMLLREAGHIDADDDSTPPHAPIPQGPGFATGEIDARGRLVMRGTLGDGRLFTGTLQPDIAFNYRLFINPYNRPDSHLAGWFPLQPHPTLGGRLYLPASDNHEVYWTKTASQKDEAYRNGFDPVTLHATFDPWHSFSGYFSATGLPSLPAALVSESASMSVEPMDINRRTGTFRIRATLKDTTLSNDLGIPAIATREFYIKGVLRQPPFGDHIVGAGLILLPVPSLKTNDSFAGQFLLKN